MNERAPSQPPASYAPAEQQGGVMLAELPAAHNEEALKTRGLAYTQAEAGGQPYIVAERLQPGGEEEVIDAEVVDEPYNGGVFEEPQKALPRAPEPRALLEPGLSDRPESKRIFAGQTEVQYKPFRRPILAKPATADTPAIPSKHGTAHLGLEFTEPGAVMDWSANRLTQNETGRRIMIEAEHGRRYFVMGNKVYDLDASQYQGRPVSWEFGDGRELPTATVGEAWALPDFDTGKVAKVEVMRDTLNQATIEKNSHVSQPQEDVEFTEPGTVMDWSANKWTQARKIVIHTEDGRQYEVGGNFRSMASGQPPNGGFSGRVYDREESKLQGRPISMKFGGGVPTFPDTKQGHRQAAEYEHSLKKSIKGDRRLLPGRELPNATVGEAWSLPGFETAKIAKVEVTYALPGYQHKRGNDPFYAAEKLIYDLDAAREAQTTIIMPPISDPSRAGLRERIMGGMAQAKDVLSNAKDKGKAKVADLSEAGLAKSRAATAAVLEELRDATELAKRKMAAAAVAGAVALGRGKAKFAELRDTTAELAKRKTATAGVIGALALFNAARLDIDIRKARTDYNHERVIT